MLALVVNTSLLLAACGGDKPTIMSNQTPGAAGMMATPPVTPGAAGAGMTGGAAGRSTTGGAAGTTTGGAAGAKPAAGGAGSPAMTTAGTPAMTTAGMPATTGGTGGAGTTGGTGGASGGAAPAGSGGDVTPGGSEESKCLDGITNYDSDGPFKYEAKTMGAVKMWVPMVPAGCKVPMVHLNNGTGASCANYINVLQRFATHGFLTLCYENANTGAGAMGVQAFDAAMKAYPDLYSKKIGSTGHSQGGQAAFTTLALAEAKYGAEFTYAGLAMEPASGFGTQPTGGSWQSVYAKIKSPMFAFSGTADMLVPQAWVQQGFDALDDKIEAYHWSAIGATHIPTPQPETMHIGVSWWRWKLLGDQKACMWFKALPMGGKWRVVKEQNAKSCM